jgi:hypothetical protein
MATIQLTVNFMNALDKDNIEQELNPSVVMDDQRKQKPTVTDSYVKAGVGAVEESEVKNGERTEVDG